MAKSKYPELWAKFQELQAERAAILEKSAPLRADRDQLLKTIQGVLAKIKDLEQRYAAIERPRLAEIDNQLGALAKAMGGKSMSKSA